MNWISLNSESQLDEIIKTSSNTPVLIFKHSTRCSISDTAKAKLERNWDEQKANGTQAYYLDLLNYKPISNKIASLFGVEHQSPQALLIKNGNCVYHNSHMAISFPEIINHSKN